jgi:hypothetical protein
MWLVLLIAHQIPKLLRGRIDFTDRKLFLLGERGHI